MKGVHPPTPSSFAPWSSRCQVVCFRTPRRLPSQLGIIFLHAIAQTPARRKSIMHNAEPWISTSLNIFLTFGGSRT